MTVVDLDKTLNDARAELAEIESRAALLRGIIAAIAGDTEQSAQTIMIEVERDWPKPKDAVLAAMRANPGVFMWPRDVITHIKALDMFNPGLKSGTNGYATALRRLAEDRSIPITGHADGTYVYEDVISTLSTLSFEYAGDQSRGDS